MNHSNLLPHLGTPTSAGLFTSMTLQVAAILCVCVLFQTAAHAQEISFPSPTAANLGKYGEQGINLFTGKPDISIPITSIGGKDIVVNIFMTYDATGVRVSEVPDWVGSGWALHAGGVITRSQRGLADETSGFGYLSSHTQQKLAHFKNKLPKDVHRFTIPAIRRAYETETITVGGQPFTALGIQADLKNGILDGEPDVFYYTFNGQAGKFILDPDLTGRGVAIPQSDLSIAYRIGTGTAGGKPVDTITGFTLTTPEGVNYVFDKIEFSQRQPGEAVTNIEPASAWYLTSIESALGDDVITFSYSSNPNDSLIVHKFNNEEYESHEITGGSRDRHFYQFHTPTYLEHITYKDQTITLKRASRQDATPPAEWDTYPLVVEKTKRLAEIEVSKQGNLVKEFVFTPLYDTNRNRLFLSQIQEFDAFGNGLPPHQFAYNDINGLPNRFSKAIDHWGFSNGKDTNNRKGFISRGVYYSNVLKEDVFVNGADRSVVEQETKKGVLTKITFPTGGRVEYAYESNTYSQSVNPLAENLADFSDALVLVNKKALTDFSGIESETFQNQATGPTFVEAKIYYTCNGVYLDYDQLYIDRNTNPGDGGNQTMFEINPTTGQDNQDHDLTCADFYAEIEGNPNEPGLYGVFIEEDVRLINRNTHDIGTYNFYFRDLDPKRNGEAGHPADEAYVIYSVYGYTDGVSGDKRGPGLRVKALTIDDGDASTPVIQKDFEYTTTSGSSSGRMHGEPIYLKRFIPDYELPHIIINNGPIAVQQFSFGMGDQGFAGYKRVTEKIGTNGKTVTHFYLNDQLTDNAKDRMTGHDGYTSYYQAVWGKNPNTLSSLYYGKPLDMTTYDNAGNPLTKAVYTENDTDDGTHANPLSSKYRTVFAVAFDNKIIGAAGGPAIQPYEIAIPFLANTKVVTTTYGSGASYTATVETEYKGNTHKNPTRVTETNSRTTEKRVTRYTYAHEQHGVLGFPNYTAMAGLNMLTQPYSVEVGNEVGSVTYSKSWTEWSNDVPATNSSPWRVTNQWVWDGNGNASDAPSDAGINPNAIKTSSIIKYDSFGNPLEVQDAAGNLIKAYYGSNTAPFSQNGMNGVSGVYLTGIQRVQGTDDCANTCGGRPASGDDLFTEARYNALGQPTTLIDENGQAQAFSYDRFGRLKTKANQNGVITHEFDYVYSVATNGGAYQAAAPNKIVTRTHTTGTGYIIPTYAAGMRKWGASTAYDYPFDGERTMKVGYDEAGWDGFRKYTYITRGTAKADLYIDPSVTSGAAHPFYLKSSDAKDILSIRYSASERHFTVRVKQNQVWADPVSLGLTAQKGRWYTIEIVRGEDPTQATLFVYPRGEDRDYAHSYTATGFPPTWSTHIQSSGGLMGGNYYLANTSLGEQIEAATYTDGLGRDIQTQQRGGNTVIATETRYNQRGLPEVVSRPIETTARAFPGFYSRGLLSGGGSFTPGSDMPPAAPVASYYAPYHTGLNDNDELYAYNYTQYEPSPLARVQKSTLPGENHQTVASQAVTTTYGLNATEIFATDAQGPVPAKNWGVNTLSKTVRKDPNGKQTITYTDGWGQVIASGVDMNGDGTLTRSSTDLVTEFAYDERGNRVRVEDPRGLATTYTYNALGQLTAKKLPDQTQPHTFIYDDKGQLRLFETPNEYGTSNGYFYHKYDDLGRMVTTGYYDNDNVGYTRAKANTPDWPTGDNTTTYTHNHYDGVHAAAGARNTQGRLTRSQYREPATGSYGYTWYSYNDLGLVEWVIQQLPGLTMGHTITYSYDELGRTTYMVYEETDLGTTFHWRYSYDELGRLARVETSTNGTTWTKDAEYTHYADGQVKQAKLGQHPAQTVDYTYTVQGWLETINNGSINTGTRGDRFGLELDYFANGNVSHQRWRQAGAIVTATQTYAYSYDQANRLTASDFSNQNGNITGFDGSFSYDKNGNITHLSRKYSSGYPNKSIPSMSYESTSNRISVISYQPGPVPASNKYVSYDANGNITSHQIQGITHASYDWRNLPTRMVTGTGTLHFAYDTEGNRVRKELTSGVETHYVRGAFGETIAVYENGNRAFVNLLTPSGDMIGSYDGSERRYFLKDHLGSVRTTVDQNGNVDSYDDYYPFGLVMSGRSSNVGNADDLYKFTGHERDDESGVNLMYAGARYSDPALGGRWLSIDPLIHLTSPKEYPYHSVSPYSYVLNNPVRYIDPNGLWVVTLQLQIRGQYFVSGSGSFGIAIDENGGLGIFGTVGFGGGAGIGATGGFEGSFYQSMSSVDELAGWGGTFGGTGYFGNIGVGIELNFPTHFFTTGGDIRDMGISIAPPFANVGAHAGIFGEASYTWLTKPSDWADAINTLVSRFGFSRSEAEEFVEIAQQVYEETKAKNDDAQKKFGSGIIMTSQEGKYIWNGEEWVKEEENEND